MGVNLPGTRIDKVFADLSAAEHSRSGRERVESERSRSLPNECQQRFTIEADLVAVYGAEWNIIGLHRF